VIGVLLSKDANDVVLAEISHLVASVAVKDSKEADPRVDVQLAQERVLHLRSPTLHLTCTVPQEMILALKLVLLRNGLR
jgi:hypothetical protein